MSNELFDYLKDKYFKSNDRTATVEMQRRQCVKNDISSLCEKYLNGAGQVLKFEVSVSDLPHVIAVIDEEPLKSMYNIVQVSQTLFEVSLKELEL